MFQQHSHLMRVLVEERQVELRRQAQVARQYRLARQARRQRRHAA